MAVAASALSDDERFFLGVERSLTGRAWRDRLDRRGQARALAIAQRTNLPELLARVLAGRDVEADAALSYLEPAVRHLLPDPNRLTDMEPAAQRLARAIAAGERIAVFGDYDVDGATASALLCRYLRQCGLDPIVIDHHQADLELPPALAVINPNRADDLSGLGHLAAVGLVFVTLVAVSRVLRLREFWSATRPQPDLLAMLHLVALGTVADMVPLKGLNRAFVAKGLLGLRRRTHPGLTALMDVARLSGPPEPWHLGFLLGPRINAGGRIGRADLGVRLLLEENPAECARIAAELDRLNAERRVIEQGTFAQAEAEALAALGLEEKGAVVVTAQEGWHPGVVGLVAARLVERFGRPAFAIALAPGGVGTGSGRSIPGVDLGRSVRQAVRDGLLLKGGGHAMAAGVTLRKDALGAFRAFLERMLADRVAEVRRERALLVDGAISAGGADVALVEMLARAGPFGAGNPEPLFALPAHLLVHADPAGEHHIRARFKAGDGRSINAIAFRAAAGPLGKALRDNRGRALHAAGWLAIDRWQGEPRVQLRLVDVAVP